MSKSPHFLDFKLCIQIEKENYPHGSKITNLQVSLVYTYWNERKHTD